ncbi:MAG: protein kinase, partial [Candidatus Hydrogenedentes bacterium]|nr:protein kinase [Candidatus Hydrogenedentota bacterium]
IHRDLKPQNIMIRPDGAVKVLDFGLAKVMSPGRMTKSSMALGTAYYQAPEQSVHLKELDARADLYSMGVILYEMLTGRIPVGTIKPASQINRAVPRKLDAVIVRCLEPEAADRPASAAALRAELDGACVKKTTRVVPSLAAAGVLVALIALAALAGLWHTRRVVEQGQAGPAEGGRPVPVEPAPDAQPPPPADAGAEEAEPAGGENYVQKRADEIRERYQNTEQRERDRQAAATAAAEAEDEKRRASALAALEAARQIAEAAQADVNVEDAKRVAATFLTDAQRDMIRAANEPDPERAEQIYVRATATFQRIADTIRRSKEAEARRE